MNPTVRRTGILAGHGDGTIGAFGTVLALPGAGIAEIPGEAMHAGGFLETGGTAANTEAAFFVVGGSFGGGGTVGCAGIRAGEFADDIAGGVEDSRVMSLDGAVGKVIIDGCAG